MQSVTIWHISTNIKYRPNTNPEKFGKSHLSSQIIDFLHCATPAEDEMRIEYIRNACEELKETALEIVKRCIGGMKEYTGVNGSLS